MAQTWPSVHTTLWHKHGLLFTQHYGTRARMLFLRLVEVVTIFLAILVVLGHVLCAVVLSMHRERLQDPPQSFLQRVILELPLIRLGHRPGLELFQPLLDDKLSVALDEGVVEVCLVFWQAVREAERDDAHEMLHLPQHPVHLWDVLVHDRTETLEEKLHRIKTQTGLSRIAANVK